MKKNDTMKVSGFFRVKITEEGKGVVGDSGWKENQVTNLGIQDYIVDWLVGDTNNGKSITHMAIGSGSEPTSNGTNLEGESLKRKAVSTSIISSKTAQFTAEFVSADSYVTDTFNISNIGLFNTSSGGTIFAGNTFASSACSTNQGVHCTYQIRFDE